MPHDAKQKREALRASSVHRRNVKNAIVFANRKTTVALLEKSLKTHGFNAGALHGDMDQSARLKMLAAFRNNEITYLIASDVAARGLDIPDVSHIFNYDVPIHAEDYVHRIGRTGAGRARRPCLHHGDARGSEISPRHRGADQDGDRLVRPGL